MRDIFPRSQAFDLSFQELIPRDIMMCGGINLTGRRMAPDFHPPPIIIFALPLSRKISFFWKSRTPSSPYPFQPLLQDEYL
ncbi:hypothetical protein CDAR_28421 [Caerostris darwini]|uniref:Uncharacterized protein n=1 Tax=Caerostris darwini TaxID=1538125 RepID=A0AAV4Q322_9ARAC|nr:hypothetical protein CDAR_28421 [Caerostris darwini]